MKKGLIVLLVMVLAVGSVFAGISGAAELRAGYNTKGQKYGFFDKSEIAVDFDFATASAETVGEGPITATAKGSLKLSIADMSYGASAATAGALSTYFDDGGALGNYGFGVFPSIDELTVAGEGWKVSYNGSYQTFVDYASSPVDTYYAGVKDAFGNYTWNTKKAVSLGAGWAYKYLPGVVAEVAGYKVGVALYGEDDAEGFSFKVETPSYTVADGLTFQLAAAASKEDTFPVKTATAAVYEVVSTNGTSTEIKEVSKAIPTSATVEDPIVYGIAAKAGYAKDALAVNVAGDVSIDDSKANFDVSLNAKYDFATVDVYYLSAAKIDQYGITKYYYALVNDEKASYEKLLSAKAVVALDQFVGLPLSVTVKGSDLLAKNNNQAISGEVSATVDAITAKVSGGYNLSAKKTTLSASVAYAADLYTASVGADLTLKENSKELVPAVSVTSDKLVSGATVGVKWAANTSYNYDGTANTKLAGLTTTNLLSETADKGNIYAFVKVAF